MNKLILPKQIGQNQDLEQALRQTVSGRLQTPMVLGSAVNPSYQAPPASETWRKAASMGLDFAPIIGDIKSGQEAITGKDLTTGERLSTIDRIFAGAGALPFVPNMAVMVKKTVKPWGGKYLINESHKRFAESPVGKAFPEKVLPEDVWYHGTQAQFDEFKIRGVKRQTSDWNTQLGIHFADEPYVANEFASGRYSGKKEGGSIIPVKLKIENPKVFKTETDLSDDAVNFAWNNKLITADDIRNIKGLSRENAEWLIKDGKLFYGEGGTILKGLGKKRPLVAKKYREHLESTGFDGIVYGNNVEGIASKAAIAFRPDQIESSLK